MQETLNEAAARLDTIARRLRGTADRIREQPEIGTRRYVDAGEVHSAANDIGKIAETIRRFT